jgi:hypothetical protein
MKFLRISEDTIGGTMMMNSKTSKKLCLKLHPSTNSQLREARLEGQVKDGGHSVPIKKMNQDKLIQNKL